MVDDRDFKTWLITPEQADRIAEGDRAEALAFFELHKDRIATMARNYARSHNEGRTSIFYDPDEMTSQVFLDLPYLNWKNALTLTMSIKQTSFAWSAYGGYAQRVQAGQIHTRNPWDLIPESESLDSPMFEEDEDGASLLDRYFTTDYEETPVGIVIARESVKPLTVVQIVERLEIILSSREAQFLALYLDGLSFSQISEELGLKDCSCLQQQTLSKLIRMYQEVIKLVYTDRELPLCFSGVVPSNFDAIVAKYEERIAKKRKGDKPKLVYATEAERREAAKESKRKWYEKNKELQNARRKERLQASRNAL